MGAALAVRGLVFGHEPVASGRSWYDNSNAYRLGYKPLDDSEPYAEAVLAAEAGQPADPIAEHYQGGTFPAAEYTAKTRRP